MRPRRSSTTRSTALTTGRADAPLRMLQSKAVAGEAALDVLDIAMRVGGGAAFRKDVGIERHFRDARAVGGDGADVGRPAGLHRPGRRAACRCSGERRHGPTHRSRSAPSPTTRRSSRSGRASRTGSPSQRLRLRLRPLLELRGARPRPTWPAHVDVTWDSPLAWVRTRRLAAAAGRTAQRRGDARHRPGPHVGRARARPTATITDVAELAGRTVATGARRLAAGDAAAARPPRRARPRPRRRRSPCGAST